MDLEKLKLAASGHWKSILERVAGIPAEYLAGGTQEHPCPKCGGNTRFRLVDEDDGAVFCSHCFSQKNGDGIAAVQWITGQAFPEACKSIAEFLGVDISGGGQGKKKTKRPEDHLEFLGQDEQLIRGPWLIEHPEITYEATRDAGGRAARFYRNTVVAFPNHGERGVTGYEIRHIAGGKISKRTKDGRYELVDKMACPGTKKSVLGPIDKIADAEVVVRAEGLTDMLVANSLLPPGWIAIAIPGSLNPTPWMAKLFAGKQVVITGDCDTAGENSARKWAQAISRHAAAVKVPRLPYAITESSGKDLRDYLLEHGAEHFLSLAANTAPFEPEIGADGAPLEPEPESEGHEKLLSDLGIDVLWEDEDSKIYVYCISTKKIRVIPSITKLYKENLVQLVGDRAANFVSQEPDSHQYTLSQVRLAIAETVSTRSADRDDFQFRGKGLWKVDDHIVACNGRHLSVWDGRDLINVEVPRYYDAVFSLSGQNWYDHDEIAALCQRAKSIDWCKQQVDGAIDFFGQWTWSQDAAPSILVGAMLATFIQTMLDWRPLMFVSGESDTGKSELYRVVFRDSNGLGMFGRLSWRASKTSAAGIRQSIKHDSCAIAIDEWDSTNPKRRTEILEMIRMSSSGDFSIMGSSHHKAVQFFLQHICWLSGRFSALKDDADENRFLKLNLVKPKSRKKWESFDIVSYEWCQDVGKRLLAIAIVHGASIAASAAAAARREVSGVHNRVVRSLAVPAAAISVTCGIDVHDVLEVMSSHLAGENAENTQVQADCDALLEEILEADADLGRGDKAQVSYLLSSGSELSSWTKQLEAKGIKAHEGGVFVTSVRKLIKGAEDKKFRQVLSLINGAERKVLRVSGKNCRGVNIPWEYLEKKFEIEKPNISFF